jgi:3',5'-nucleoside bisphosphate phosphatase
MSTIDLHIHSQFSFDSDSNISEIIEICQKNKIQTISITDHNSIKCYKEIKNKKMSVSTNIIPGIELDCSYKGHDFHLLGYNINVESNDFDDWQREFTKRKLEAVPKKIENLQKLGFLVDIEQVINKSHKEIPGEELMAEVILNNKQNRNHPLLQPYYPGGDRCDMPLVNFYWDFFSYKKDAYVPVKYLSVRKAVELVKENGGIPILAHPGANFKNDINVIDEIVKHGISGLEVFSTYHTEAQVQLFKAYAITNKLVMTCGSDYHGSTKPLVKIGGIDCHQMENGILEMIS